MTEFKTDFKYLTSHTGRCEPDDPEYCWKCRAAHPRLAKCVEQEGGYIVPPTFPTGPPPETQDETVTIAD